MLKLETLGQLSDLPVGGTRIHQVGCGPNRGFLATRTVQHPDQSSALWAVRWTVGIPQTSACRPRQGLHKARWEGLAAARKGHCGVPASVHLATANSSKTFKCESAVSSAWCCYWKTVHLRGPSSQQQPKTATMQGCPGARQHPAQQSVFTGRSSCAWRTVPRHEEFGRALLRSEQCLPQQYPNCIQLLQCLHSNKAAWCVHLGH